MSRTVGRGGVPAWVTASVLGVVVAIGLVVGYVALTAGPADPPKSAPPADAVLPDGSYPREPLAVGEVFPPFEAGGWLNGEPHQPGDGKSRLIVVDVWADWCPVCRQTAPGLVEAHQQFAEAGVAFVSFTSLGRSEVESFARAYQIPWPCAFGASAEAVARIGAYSTDRMSAFYHPKSLNYHVGHEVTPTLFVIGPDGRVIWNDRQARPRHLKDGPGVLHELVETVEHALGEHAGTK
jgi:thiol-disulfide isomerase/thioredoxin